MRVGRWKELLSTLPDDWDIEIYADAWGEVTIQVDEYRGPDIAYKTVAYIDDYNEEMYAVHNGYEIFVGPITPTSSPPTHMT